MSELQESNYIRVAKWFPPNFSPKLESFFWWPPQSRMADPLTLGLPISAHSETSGFKRVEAGDICGLGGPGIEALRL